jgi:hypothetical protein
MRKLNSQSSDRWSSSSHPPTCRQAARRYSAELEGNALVRRKEAAISGCGA